MEIPILSEDYTPLLYRGAVKGTIRYDYTNGEYVLEWYQDPFYIMKGFSMSAGLKKEIPDNIERIIIISEKEERFYEYDRDVLDNKSQFVPMDAKIFKFHPGDDQYAVRFEQANGSWPIERLKYKQDVSTPDGK